MAGLSFGNKYSISRQVKEGRKVGFTRSDHSKTIVRYDKDGNEITRYRSLGHACESTGLAYHQVLYLVRRNKSKNPAEVPLTGNNGIYLKYEEKFIF